MTFKSTAFSLLLLIGVDYAYSQNKNQMTQEEEKVLATVEKMTSNFEKGNIDAVMQFYEPHASVLFDPDKPVSDTDTMRKMFQEWAAAKPKFEYNNGHQVVVTNNIAIHIAPWDMSAKMPDGEVMKKSGLSVAVLRKQDNGDWLMVIDNPHGQILLDK
ncbi:YybH family protein [Reichenbachiella versicolor]|uniref:YybH family protein n=1 Tax=Reichenbachiella versicolor TaxID=1821036 RepID=UPI000D6DCE4B|nr:DUF4440 domain-containing protein [Reichenbachiella versicolor]